MTPILHAFVLGAFALPSCTTSSESELIGRSYGNGYNVNSYDDNSNSNTDSYSKGLSNSNAYSKSYGVGSSFVVSPYHSEAGTAPSYTYNPQEYNQAGYYGYSPQDRFHPHTSFKTNSEDDSHTGEVVLPPASTNSQDLVASASIQEDNVIQANPTAVGSATVEVVSDPPPVLYQNYDYSQPPTSPPLPSGYDYHPPPPPLPPPPPPPPPPAPTPYYYYPPPKPSNQYLPAPVPPPPSNQYLPAPTPPPPQEERQVDYTYYYLGPKLWYVPLFFSIYFVLYVGALIIKAVSKHKILFPQQLYNAATSVYQARGSRLEEVTARVTKALAQSALRYLSHRRH